MKQLFAVRQLTSFKCFWAKFLQTRIIAITKGILATFSDGHGKKTEILFFCLKKNFIYSLRAQEWSANMRIFFCWLSRLKLTLLLFSFLFVQLYATIHSKQTTKWFLQIFFFFIFFFRFVSFSCNSFYFFVTILCHFVAIIPFLSFNQVERALFPWQIVKDEFCVWIFFGAQQNVDFFLWIFLQHFWIFFQNADKKQVFDVEH